MFILFFRRIWENFALCLAGITGGNLLFLIFFIVFVPNVSGEIGWLLKQIFRLCLQFVDDVTIEASQQGLMWTYQENSDF